MEKETYWSRFADDFEERNNYVAGKQNIEAVRDVLAEQNLSGKVLELGCGNGTHSAVLAQTADRVFATDFSDQMVAVSAVRLKSLSNVVVEKQNCFSLSYPESSFDSVVMVNLLHIIPTPEQAIDECKRVLKHNGRAVVVSFTTEGVKPLAKAGMIYRYFRTYGKPPAAAQRLTVNKTTSMLAEKGFRVNNARLIGTGMKAVFVSATTIQN